MPVESARLSTASGTVTPYCSLRPRPLQGQGRVTSSDTFMRIWASYGPPAVVPVSQPTLLGWPMPHVRRGGAVEPLRGTCTKYSSSNAKAGQVGP